MANEQTSVPLFVADTILTAAQQNISAATGVPVFASTVTRDAAFGGANKALAEGQLCYLSATDVVQYYDGAAWATVGPSATGTKIGQVVSTVLLSSFTTSSTSYVDVTGLSVAITPTLATSKVLVTVTLQGSQATTGEGFFRLLRDSTPIGSGTSGSVENGFAMTAISYYFQFFSGAFTFLDSPATTSATTYKVQASTDNSGTIVVNRRGYDTAFGGSSTITVSEVIV